MHPPQILLVNRTEWQCYTYAALVVLKRSNLTLRAQKLRDIVGADGCPPLLMGLPNEAIAQWVTEVQAAACARFMGIATTAADYGAPYPTTAPTPLSPAESDRMRKEGHHLPLPASVNPKPMATIPAGPDAISSHRVEFAHDPSYVEATMASNAAADVNKSRNLTGELSHFIFAEPAQPTAEPYTPNPPFLVAPAGVRPGTTGTIHETSYRPPPPGYQRREYVLPQQQQQRV